ncbi:hypothetical protein EV401DRAFT_2057563 [Pisolithus croceorrhizus]|nr:hypothetical protein EV401DRAFT_2057563 [Pisolithus croceorrhizus]
MIVPIILASDKVPVMRMSGDHEMHPLFLTIVNINSEVHMKAKAHAWACMVYTPIPEFLTHPDFHSILEAHVWHCCMDIVCANLKHKYVGTHHFTGISHVKQMTRHEHHNIQPTIIAAIAGGADADFVCAIHAIVDFIYHAQAPTFMTSSIQEMEACLVEFHQYKGRTGDIPHFQVPKLELFQSFGHTICRVGSLIQYTADMSKHLLITHAKNPFLHMNCKAGFTEQITCYLNHEESIHQFNLYTLLCTDGVVVIKTVPVDYIYTSLVNISARGPPQAKAHLLPVYCMLTLEDGAIPLPHSVVPEEDYSFTRSATFHNHFLQGFISDDAMTAFHVTQKPDFTDKSISYVSMTYGLPDLPSLLLSYINGVAGQNSSFHSWLLRGWSKFRIQMHSWLRPLMILPSQQVQALPSSKEYPYGKCDTVLAHVTSPFGTPTTLVVQVCTVFALSMRGNALPPDLSYPLLYVQCFTFIATPAEQPEIRMYTVHHMFIENINGGRY